MNRVIGFFLLILFVGSIRDATVLGDGGALLKKKSSQKPKLSSEREKINKFLMFLE